MNLHEDSFEFTPAETSAGGTLLYTAYHLLYKCRNDLNIYKKNETEYLFIKIVNPRKSNIAVVVGLIYRHPAIDLSVFTSNYLSKRLEKISKEQKSYLEILILTPFNNNEDNKTNDFLKSLA